MLAPINGPVVSIGESRRTRRRRELHQHIRDTAADLFARQGYDATTVEQIADAADIAQATFFNHFPSKEDVLRELGTDVFLRFRRLVDEQIARHRTSGERLRGFADSSAALVRRAPEMTRRVLVAVLRSSRPGESSAELASMQSDFVRLLGAGGNAPGGTAADVRRGKDDGTAASPVERIELAAEMLVSIVTGAMTRWINDPTYPLETRLTALLSLVERVIDNENDDSASPPRARRKPK
ncbi:MAG TPA: TetR/AcrR family transcriptional regulator [Candidatus Binatia bacterium]